MAKILSIEVGNSITRVCEMDYKAKTPKVYKYFSIPTPQGVVEDGFVHENHEFIGSLKSALRENKITTKNVIFSVTSTKIVTREVTIPSIKLNQIGNYVKANANDYFPIELSVYEIAYVLLGNESSEDGKDKLRIMVIAAGKDLISGYANLASACGLKLNSIDYIGNGIYQMMRAESTDGATLVVKLEDKSAIASVISNGNLVLQRSLAYGTDRAIKAVVDSKEYYESDYDAAFKLMCQKPCIKAVLNERTRMKEQDLGNDDSEHAAEAREKVTATFTQLIGNLVRVVELYNSKDPMNPIRSIILTGAGAEIKNLTQLFTNEIGISTSVLRSSTSVNMIMTDSDSMGRYVGCLGAGISCVGLTANDVGMKKKMTINYGLLTIMTLIVAIGIFAYLTLSAMLPYQEAQKEEARLKELEAKYQEAEVVHKQYENVQQLFQEVEQKCAMLNHPNDNMLDFIMELEEKFPSDVQLTALVSDGECATLSMKTKDFDEGAKVIQILRGFESVQDVVINGIETVEETDDEEGFTQFDVACYYDLSYVKQ